MRKFVSTVVMTTCAILSINMIFAIGVLSYRNIKLLVEGLINISLVLELIGSVVIFGILVAIFKFVDDNNYDHRPTPSIEELTKPEQPTNPFKNKKVKPITGPVEDSFHLSNEQIKDIRKDLAQGYLTHPFDSYDEDETLERVRKGMSLENLSDSEKLELDEWNKQYDETLDKLRRGE